MKKFIERIPLLPLSAIIFYLASLILFYLGAIPPPAEIISFLENLYNNYGLFALFVAAFFESLVYVGLYFAGSFIMLFIVLFSDGKFLTLFSISLVITLAILLASIINYAFGKNVIFKAKGKDEIKGKRGVSKGLLFSCLHPNALAFYFFNLGLKKEGLWKLFFVPFITIPYIFLLSYFIYLAKPFFERNAESPLMLVVLLIWFTIAFILKNKK